MRPGTSLVPGRRLPQGELITPRSSATPERTQ